MPQLKVHIKPEEDDKQEIDSLSRSLQDDLLNLNQVENVQLSYEKPPTDSKAFDGVALGSMMVDIIGGGAIKEVTQTIRAWIDRNRERGVTIEMDGDKIEVKGISAKDQQKIIDAWIMRQQQKMMK